MEKSNGKACGICGMWFSSGKAIGGHLRSHYVKLPIPPKLETNNQVVDNSADLTQRPNKSASAQTCNPDKFSAFSASSNRENGYVSYQKTPTHKRSECSLELNAADGTKDMSEDPGVMMVWGFYKDAQKREGIKKQKIKAEDGESSRSDSLSQAYSQARFNCDRCRKMFRFYQALGGHKAYCKSDNDGGLIDQKPFQCAYCTRVFKSPQALGGHKRVHSSGANEFEGCQ